MDKLSIVFHLVALITWPKFEAFTISSMTLVTYKYHAVSRIWSMATLEIETKYDLSVTCSSIHTSRLRKWSIENNRLSVYKIKKCYVKITPPAIYIRLLYSLRILRSLISSLISLSNFSWKLSECLLDIQCLTVLDEDIFFSVLRTLRGKNPYSLYKSNKAMQVGISLIICCLWFTLILPITMNSQAFHIYSTVQSKF